MFTDYDDSFKGKAAALIDWALDYAAKIEDQPVRAVVSPGDILAKLPDAAPEHPEEFATLLSGLSDLLPGITHWQHPRFFAYFPANMPPENMLAEIALAAMGVNAMLWETSPAATELEMRTTAWLRDAMGLPDNWHGVIQDTASSATFSAVLAARERALEGRGNRDGLHACPPLTIYVSEEAHSSIEKAARMAGLGSKSIRRVPTDDTLAMDPEALSTMMQADKAAGFIPAALMVTAGGTGTGAFDRAGDVIPVAREYGAYVHVDAAWAGPAMLSEDLRPRFAGVEIADSFVFNPHKWLGIGFDCSIQFLAAPQVQIDALTVKPVYLESVEGVVDYSDWSPVLGRKNRGLKIWMVTQLIGLKRMRESIEHHVAWTADLADLVRETDGFDVVTEPNLALFTFRYKDDQSTLALFEAVNREGTTYLTKTNVAGRPVIRWAIGVWRTEWRHVLESWEAVKRIAAEIKG